MTRRRGRGRRGRRHVRARASARASASASNRAHGSASARPRRPLLAFPQSGLYDCLESRDSRLQPLALPDVRAMRRPAARSIAVSTRSFIGLRPNLLSSIRSARRAAARPVARRPHRPRQKDRRCATSRTWCAHGRKRELQRRHEGAREERERGDYTAQASHKRQPLHRQPLHRQPSKHMAEVSRICRSFETTRVIRHVFSATPPLLRAPSIP